MKRIALLSLFNAALLLSATGFAQTMPGEGATRIWKFSDLGVKAGINMQQVLAYPFKSDYSQGYTAGLYYEKRHNSVALRVELNASTATFTTDNAASKRYKVTHDVLAKDTVTKAEFSTLYVNLPVMVDFKFGKHFNFLMGAQYSRLVSITDKNSTFKNTWGSDKIFKDDYFSLIFGGEFEMFKRMRLGATYTQGFTDINNNKYPGVVSPWMTGSAQVYLTYKIRRWH